MSRLAPDTAPLPPRRLELYLNSLQSEESQDGAFFTSELCRQVRGPPEPVSLPF